MVFIMRVMVFIVDFEQVFAPGKEVVLIFPLLNLRMFCFHEIL